MSELEAEMDDLPTILDATNYEEYSSTEEEEEEEEKREDDTEEDSDEEEDVDYGDELVLHGDEPPSPKETSSILQVCLSTLRIIRLVRSTYGTVQSFL